MLLVVRASHSAEPHHIQWAVRWVFTKMKYFGEEMVESLKTSK